MTSTKSYFFSLGRKPINRRHNDPNERTVGHKYKAILVMLLVSLCLFGGIGSRLAYLQLVQGDKYRQQAEDNRIRLIPMPPVRGNIYDRQGKLLANTRFSYSAFIWPMVQKKPGWEQTVRRLAEILSLPAGEIRQLVVDAGYNSPTLVRLARNLTPAQITAIKEYHQELEGVELSMEPMRYYPQGELAAHVLGHTREINAETLQKLRPQGYRLGDIIGQMGVETAFESILRGEWGAKQVEVDGTGRIVQLLGEKPAQAGRDIILTIDLELQKAAELALGDRVGAIVALDANNGGVLAMVSNPGFDPNIFSSRITPEIWQQLLAKGDPFINRALRGFPPASTFKIVTATAGMETGKFPANTMLETSAYILVGRVKFHDWNRAGFGRIGYVKALAWSSNTFFGQVGRGIGSDNLIAWAQRYGFGQKTGIEIPGESAGLIADPAWKKKWLQWDWGVGDTVNMSIGQGFTLATPLQLAVMFAVPANGGYKIQPHLLKNNEAQQVWRESLNLQPRTVRTLRRGLREVIVSGTGDVLNVSSLPPVAGKSGTAEAPPKPPHAWFGAFAPYDKPEIVVVAFAEHSGGGGGSVTGPIVRQVMEAYFQSAKK